MGGRPNPPYPYPPNDPIPCDPHPRPQPDDLRKPTNPLYNVTDDALRRWQKQEKEHDE
jgi:hypothetical protein